MDELVKNECYRTREELQQLKVKGASELDGINPFLMVADRGPCQETDDEIDNLNYGSITCVKKRRHRERRAGPVSFKIVE